MDRDHARLIVETINILEGYDALDTIRALNILLKRYGYDTGIEDGIWYLRAR